jgi:hypothetical protein
MPTFYRVVMATSLSTLAADSFKSNAALGRSLHQPHTSRRLDLWDGISVWDSIDAARGNSRRFPEHGSFATVMDIVEGAFRLEKTFGAGHWTLWGDPVDLLAMVHSVVPLFEQGGVL